MHRVCAVREEVEEQRFCRLLLEATVELLVVCDTFLLNCSGASERSLFLSLREVASECLCHFTLLSDTVFEQAVKLAA